MPLAWQPDKGKSAGPQRRFLVDLREVYEVLHEGGVGSGKTDAGVMAPVWYREYRRPDFRALILRHDEKDLKKDIMPRVSQRDRYPRYVRGYMNESEFFYRSAVGARYIFAHAKRLSALHGPEFQYVWWDELSHWAGDGWEGIDPPEAYLFVSFTRVRAASGVTPRVRSGSNILGPGKGWIRWRWGPWLSRAEVYLAPPRKAPPKVHAQVESMRQLIEGGHVPPPRPGQPLVPSGAVLWFLPQPDGGELWVPPGTAGALSRTCLRSHTRDNVALAAGDPEYATRVLAAGPRLSAKLIGDDWDAPDEADEGFFSRTWFPVVQANAVPRLAGEISRLDFAWSRHERGGARAERSPWSVRVRLGWTEKHPVHGRDWYVKHIVRDQGDPGQVMRLFEQTARADGRTVPIVAPVDFSSGKAVLHSLRTMLEGFQIVEQRESGEKDIRIKSLQAPAEARRVHLVEGEWNHAFLDEVARYPRRPVDQIDALAGAYLWAIDAEDTGLPSADDRQEHEEVMIRVAQALSRGDQPREVVW